MIFDYPEHRRQRRHGPSGYASYESYRPWLRDEFSFRCVYCLKRESWGLVTGEFDLDHFEPQSVNPQRRLDYFNLVYACRRCNSVKHGQAVGDPFNLLHSGEVAVRPLYASAPEARRLIRELDLNSPRLKAWRTMWMRIVALAARFTRAAKQNGSVVFLDDSATGPQKARTLLDFPKRGRSTILPLVESVARTPHLLAAVCRRSAKNSSFKSNRRKPAPRVSVRRIHTCQAV